jgi:prepilin-type N-terminal cleavage/methylation domain-containing protein
MRHRGARAFSLVEVMAASAIFAVGLAAIFSAFGTSAQQFEHQRHTTYALHLAEAKMEELLLRVSSDPELAAGTTFGPNWFDMRGFPSTTACPSATTGLPALSSSCRYRVTWSSVPAQVPQVRITTVVATWNERESEKSVQFATQRN